MTEENQNKESQIQEETVSSLSEVVKEDISKKMDTTVDEEKTTNTETNENDMKGIISIFHNSILLNLLHHLRGGLFLAQKMK